MVIQVGALSVSPRTVQQGTDGNPVTMAYFSELSDCGKSSLFYSGIFLFFSYKWERDWWRQQQKKNNYRQWESTTTQNSIVLSAWVNHFRKGSRDKSLSLNSSLGWYSPRHRKENCNTWHRLTCWAIADCSHTARSSEIKERKKTAHFNLQRQELWFFFFSIVLGRKGGL